MNSSDRRPDDDEENDALIRIAGQIARGEAVDWEAARATGAPAAEIAALFDIAAVEVTHQQSEDAPVSGQGAAADLPRSWGHLQVLERIGSGQFGEVFRAFDPSLQKEVALKLSYADAPPGYAAQVIQEARLLARVDHPNVVCVHGAEYRGGRAGFWMDLVRGRTLEQMLKTQRFSASEAALIGRDLSRALAAVHAVNVLHGDVKAHNVMRSDDGETVLVDFGAGRTLDGGGLLETDTAGTLVYLAPEVLAGEPRSRCSDIYSLGVLLFHLVTDTFPVFGGTIDEIRAAHARGEVKRLGDCRPGLPEWFVRAVECATAADPKRRYSTASAMESDLASMVGLPGPAPRERRWLPWAAAVAAVAITVAGTVLAVRWPATSAPSAGPALPTAKTPLPDTATPSIPDPPGSFGIQAAFYRVAGTEVLARLSTNDVVGVNDQLALSVTATKPAYVYVVNEDDTGDSYLLFPLPGQGIVNPLPANQEVRLPGTYNWEVSTAGGKEHFLVFASAERLEAFEERFRDLPPPRLDAPPRSEPLPPGLEQKLRAVGRLAPAKPTGPGWRNMFTTPLGNDERVSGLWVRQLTLTNRSTSSSASRAR